MVSATDDKVLLTPDPAHNSISFSHRWASNLKMHFQVSVEYKHSQTHTFSSYDKSLSNLLSQQLFEKHGQWSNCVPVSPLALWSHTGHNEQPCFTVLCMFRCCGVAGCVWSSGSCCRREVNILKVKESGRDGAEGRIIGHRLEGWWHCRDKVSLWHFFTLHTSAELKQQVQEWLHLVIL